VIRPSAQVGIRRNGCESRQRLVVGIGHALE
jgi:hypothetical protein